MCEPIDGGSICKCNEGFVKDADGVCVPRGVYLKLFEVCMFCDFVAFISRLDQTKIILPGFDF